MIIIKEKYSEANGYKLANMLHLKQESSNTEIIAVGDQMNWASEKPLPHDVITIDLLKASVNEANLSGQYWYSFLNHLIHISDLKKPILWWLGIGKVKVVIDIHDVAVKNLVLKVLKNSALNKKFQICN